MKKPTFKTEVTVANLNKAYNKDELVDLVVMLYGLVETHENCAERAQIIAMKAIEKAGRTAQGVSPGHVRFSTEIAEGVRVYGTQEAIVVLQHILNNPVIDDGGFDGE